MLQYVYLSGIPTAIALNHDCKGSSCYCYQSLLSVMAGFVLFLEFLENSWESQIFFFRALENAMTLVVFLSLKNSRIYLN